MTELKTKKKKPLYFISTINIIKERYKSSCGRDDDFYYRHNQHWSHPCNCGRFQECKQYSQLLFFLFFLIKLITNYSFTRLFRARARAQGRRPGQCRMVLPTFYIDVFEQARSRNASVEGIYMSFANAPTSEHRAASSRILLCEVPPGCDLFEALRIVVIEPMRLLERGIDVEFKSAGIMRCYGSIYCVLGDHPSQAKLAGRCNLTAHLLC